MRILSARCHYCVGFLFDIVRFRNYTGYEMSNSRFATAIHICCLLALSEGKGPITSDYMAASVNTNPVVIRRILALLRKARIVASTLGTNGGWLLSEPKE